MSTQALPAVADSASAVADEASSQAPAAPNNNNNDAFIGQLKRLYSADQQTEYLFIQAEADSLLVQLEQIKTQKR